MLAAVIADGCCTEFMLLLHALAMFLISKAADVLVRSWVMLSMWALYVKATWGHGSPAEILAAHRTSVKRTSANLSPSGAWKNPKFPHRTGDVLNGSITTELATPKTDGGTATVFSASQTYDDYSGKSTTITKLLEECRGL